MMRRALGTSDHRISLVGIGAFAMGGWMWGGQAEDDSVRAIHAAVEAGVNWIDTAPIYGSGVADRAVARALGELPPERRPLVFTKFGHRLVDGQRVACASRAQVIADCEGELAALGVDALDLFQHHLPAPEPIAETAAACAELLRAGKIRAIGVSNYSVAQLEAWRATGVPVHSVQNMYSLVRPEAADDVLPWCAEKNVGFLAHSPLHRGLLSGSWERDKTFAAGDHRGERDDFKGPRLARWLDAVDELRALAAEDELTVPQLAIGALLCTEGLTACIVGARTAEQGAALGELGLPVTGKQFERIEAIAARARADLAGAPG